MVTIDKHCTLFAYLALVLLFAGCGSQRTTVREGSNTTYKSSTISVLYDANQRGVHVDDDRKNEFETALKRLLTQKGFAQGDGLILRYWFSDADEGSRAARYWIGFGAGSGKMLVSVEFYDARGNKLATTDNVGTVSGGFVGGTFSEAIRRSAETISTYTQKTFLGRNLTSSTTSPLEKSPTAPSSVQATPSGVKDQPVIASTPGLQTWQLAVNTTPQGAIIKAYDSNQNLYQIGKSPTGLLWPLQTQADALVLFWQGRQVTVIPNQGESVQVDFTKIPPEVKGASVIEQGR